MVIRVNAIASYPPPNAKSERRNDTGTIFECNLVLLIRLAVAINISMPKSA